MPNLLCPNQLYINGYTNTWFRSLRRESFFSSTSSPFIPAQVLQSRQPFFHTIVMIKEYGLELMWASRFVLVDGKGPCVD